MSTKKPAATAAPKAARKPRSPSLTMAQKFDLLAFIKLSDPTLPDATLAAEASAKFGHAVTAQSVAGYRKQFGMASVKKPSAADLLAENAALKARIAELTGHGSV